MTDKPWAGMTCTICGETVTADDDGQILMVVNDEHGAHQEAAHRECMALGIIGHRWGVCSCTGYGKDRAAALELKRRIYAEVYKDLQ
jgi:hypothetical protein